MLTNEERIAALHSRAVKISREQDQRRYISACAAAAAVCIALLAGMTFLVPKIQDESFSGAAAEWMNASIFTDSKILGYITIAILSFLLGITLTVFCFRLKK